MTVTGFCALAALAFACREPGQLSGQPSGMGDRSGLSVQELAELQRELFAARTAVNRTGVNLNQAVAALTSTGQAPVWLEHAVDPMMTAPPGAPGQPGYGSRGQAPRRAMVRMDLVPER